MREILSSGRFKRDLKRQTKRRKDLSKLTIVIDLLAKDQELPIKMRPHKLVGEYTNLWECHIEPDWLLIYDLEVDGVLGLVATGTHADLFK